MKANNYKGIFISFDGPDGVGKSTIVHEVDKQLKAIGFKVLCTKESTSSELGEFIKKHYEKICGYSLACLVAADRYEHLNNKIIPALESTSIVLCDRYFLSSLILQRMDIVEQEFIINIHENILIPDIQIALTADQKTINSRLAERKKRCRFETRENINRQLIYLKEGVKHLKAKGVRVDCYDTNADITDNMDLIIKSIIEIAAKKGIITSV